MMKLRPAAAARSRTDIVAMTVVAMPRTAVSGLPALNVSTVSVRHVTPRFAWMRSTTRLGVSEDCVAARDCSQEHRAGARGHELPSRHVAHG